MTEFASPRLPTLLRARFAVLAGCGAFVFAMWLAFDNPWYLVVATALALDLGFTFFARTRQAAWGQAGMLRLLLLADMLVIATAVFASGGIQGGLAALYTLPLFIALLLLGRQDAVRFVVLGGGLFLLQIFLDVNNIHAHVGAPSLLALILGQGAIVLLLLSIILVLASLMVGVTRTLSQDKRVAEQAQTRWALINNAALRVQEAMTPDDVFAAIGDELERSGLHCVVLQWNKPDVSMRVVYASMPHERLQSALELFHVDLAKFDIPLERTIGLKTTVAGREAFLLKDSSESMPHLLPQLPVQFLRALLTRFELRTMVFAPMLHGDKVNGVLLVFSNTLTEADVAPLAALANQTGSALEKARLLAEQRKRTAQLEIVSGLSARVNVPGSLQENLQAIVNRVRREFGYLNVGIFEIAPDQQRVSLLAGSGMLVEQTGTPYTQSLKQGILGLAARAGETYLARDARLDPNYLTLLGADDPVRSELTIPFKQGDTVLGLLDVQSTQPDGFDPNDVAALSILAEQIGSALVKARALAAEQKRAAHLAWVSEVAAQATAFAEPEQIIRQLVELVQLRFGYHHVCYSTYDAARHEMELEAVAGSNAALYAVGERWSAERGLIGLAARGGQSVLSGNVRQDARYIPDQDDMSGANSELCVPFQTAGGVLGVLDVESLAYDAFDGSDIGAMEALANQIAVALERAYSLRVEQRRSAQLALVNQIASRMTRLAPAQELLQEAAELIRSQFGYFNVAVFETEPESAGARLVAIAGALGAGNGQRTVMLTEGIIVHVANVGATYLCQDAQKDALYRSPFPPGVPAPVQTELALPLRRGSNVIGVLDIQSVRRGEFAETDVTTFEILADQLATALENARLFEAEARRAAQLEAVRQMTLKVTAERDLDALLHAILFSAVDLVDADAASLDLVDPEHNDLRVYISHNLPRDYTGYRMQFGEGLTGAAAASGEAIIVDDYALWDKHVNWFPTDELAGMMAVPLQWQKRVLGVIVLHRRRGRARFTQQELHLAGLFAAQAAIALENANLLEAVQARLRVQRALTETSGRLVTLTEPQTILDEVTRSALATLNSTVALLFLDNGVGELAIASRVGQMPEGMNEDVLPLTFRSVLGRTYRTRQPLFWRREPHADATPLAQVTTANDFEFGVMVPMQREDRAVGVLAVARNTGRAFDTTDAQTLALLANQTANALERADAFRQERQRANELHLLFESFRATVSTLDPDEVIHRLLEQLVTALDVTSGSFVQLEHARRELFQSHVYYADTASAGERRMDGRIWSFERLPELERLMTQSFVVLQADDATLANETRAYLRANDLCTILRVPLFIHAQAVGFFSLYESRAPRRWDSNQILFVQTMASQATVALVNAELYQAAQTRTRELQALYEAGRVLSQSLDLDTLCENSVDALRDVLGYHHVSIYFVVGAFLELQVERGYPPEMVLQRIPLTQGVMARAVRNRETVFVEDVSTDPDFLLALNDVQSEIAVPLMAGERVVGVLNVEAAREEIGEPHRKRLTVEDVRVLNTFANQLVVAIENARLFQEAQQRLHETETLYRYTRELGGTLEIEALGARALEAVARLTDFDFGEVCLVREADNALVPLVFNKPPEGALEDYVVPPGVGILGWVAEHGRSVRLDDVTRDPRYVALSPHTMSEICLPLRVGARTIGVLNLEAKAPHAFDARAEQLLTVFAQQLAIAVENARLYAQTKRDAELKAVLLQELSHRVKNNLAAITSLLYMALDEPEEMRAQILSETLGRVQSMSTAHALMARAADGMVDLLEVGAQVLQDTVRNLASPAAQIQIETEGDHVRVPMRQLTTLALVLNELATNVLRHGWNPQRTTPLQLRFVVARLPEEIVFWVQDNGAGLPQDFELTTRAGLGLSLVQSLVEKDLRGTFTLARQGLWTSAQVQFRAQEEYS